MSLDGKDPETAGAAATVEELLAIARRVSALVEGPYLDHAEFLYDEQGLPK